MYRAALWCTGDGRACAASRLWCGLSFPRLSLIPVPAEEYTEEAAARLDDEIQRLEVLLARMTPILKMIMRREWFKKEMKVSAVCRYFLVADEA